MTGEQAGLRIRRWHVGAAVALVVAAGIVSRFASHADEASTPTARVVRGQLAARLTAMGTLRPVESFTYHSPVPGRDVEILELAPEGSHVDTGDTLVRLDATDVERELVRARDEQRQAQIDLEVADGEWDEARAQLQAVTDGDGALTVAEARSRRQLAERRAARLAEEYAQLEPLLARGFITREELGRSASEHEQAQADLALARQRAEVVEQLSHPRERKKAELALAQKASQQMRARARVVETGQRLSQLAAILDACIIVARGPGLVVYEEFLSSNPRRKIRVGDRVTSSQGLVTIPEVNRMLVDASVSEADVHRVREGLHATVHVEAFPGVNLSGAITSVGTVAATSPFRPQQDKRFALTVALDPAQAALRPDMSARAEIQVTERTNVLLIPVNAVFEDAGGFAAHRVGRAGIETRPVVLGETDDRQVEVLSGLEEGDVVLLASPVSSGSADSGTRKAGFVGAR